MSARIETQNAPDIRLRSVAIAPVGTNMKVGMGFAIDSHTVLTSRRAISAAKSTSGENVSIRTRDRISVIAQQRSIEARVGAIGQDPSSASRELVLLHTSSVILPSDSPPVNCASTLRYSGRRIALLGKLNDNEPSVIYGQIGSSDGDEVLELVQLDGTPFEGAPVWCDDLEAFIGVAVSSTASPGSSILCLKNSALCSIYRQLPVRFRIPDADRPVIRDFKTEDPNVNFFGSGSERNGRKLSATIGKDENGRPVVKMKYQIEKGSPPPRGRFVTFITYPDMKDYQIFEEIGDTRMVDAECRPAFPDFTIAAIGDAGDTRLTFNLEELPGSKWPADSEEQISSNPPYMRETAAEQRDAGLGYRPTYSVFTTDLVAFDQRSFDAVVKDSLNNEGYANHLAQLIVARQTPLPLSLGLFGDWGAGKSFFMRLLHQRIKALEGKNDACCRKVVQIHFNAWHYLDTNLWANLVCEIFDHLFQALIDRPDTPNQKVEALKKKLADESALAAEARKALDDAREAREEAEKKLQHAVQERQEKEKSFAAFIDDLKQVVLDAGLKTKLNELSSGFGVNRLNESFAELEARANEARSLGGRFRTLGLALLSPEGRGRRLALLFAALLIPIILAFGVSWLLEMKDKELASFGRSITAAVSLLGTVATWISAQTKRGAELINKLETTYESVKKSREKVRAQDSATVQQQELDKRIKAEAEAKHALDEAQAKVRAIESELRELAPGRRLLKFLEHRSGANDYRQHLGLVSLVRRDFEQLSTLLREADEFKEDDQPMLDRIVLYIDDLDRCKSARVIEVLEAVHLLLAFPIFAVVVAVDPRWLRKSLVEHYPTLLAGGQQQDGTVITGARESLASPQDFLEKIFQVPFQLQPLEEGGFGNLVTELLPVRSAGSGMKKEQRTAARAKVELNLPPESEPNQQTNEFSGASGTRAQRDTGALNSSEPSDAIEAPGTTGTTTTGAIKPRGVTPRETTATIAPERLELEEWEQEAVKKCHPLFRTPRAVKRLANTYCLIRTGVEESAWEGFLGSAARPEAEYRTPLLMLAVAAAYPGLAGRWLDTLRHADQWFTTDPNASDGWVDLMTALNSMDAAKFASFDKKLVERWIPKVKRYSF